MTSSGLPPQAATAQRRDGRNYPWRAHHRHVQTPDGSRLAGATVRIFGTEFAELPNLTSDDATLQVTGPLSTRISTA